MNSLTIWYGKEKPIRAVGKHQANLLGFAYKYQGWHSFSTDKTTLRAVSGLVKRGCLEINQFNQFRFIFPRGE